MKGLKTLRSVEPFTIESKDTKMKFCVNDGNVATHTAYFSVEGAIIIERYYTAMGGRMREICCLVLRNVV